MKKSKTLKRIAKQLGIPVVDIKARKPKPSDLMGLPSPSLGSVWTAPDSIKALQDTLAEAIETLQECTARAQVLASSLDNSWPHLEPLALSIKVLADHLRTEILMCKSDLATEQATRNP